ncbi:efflux RND transporter periplasmic adaptor subunit [Clostridium thailandense]|uniref:efflux RND transporter periplasmic adaptor subunit n=1 Tax=Clostridium thailandense TaxID=2794346 RepID=UPI003988FE23
MKRKSVIITIIILALIIGGSIGYYYSYQGGHYVKTEDARVSADMLTITPQATGTISQMTVKEGDVVNQGQSIGIQNVTTASGATQSSIIAPLSGKVIQLNALKGQLAAPGTNLGTVADTGSSYISANIKETDIENIEKGQKVDISIDAFPEKLFAGTVASIGQAANSTFSLLPSQNTSSSYTKVTQLIPIRISIDDFKGTNIMPGMNAFITIYIR